MPRLDLAQNPRWSGVSRQVGRPLEETVNNLQFRTVFAHLYSDVNLIAFGLKYRKLGFIHAPRVTWTVRSPDDRR